MVQTLGTDSNNDIYIGKDGNLALLSGLDAVKSACETATKAQLGEMVLAIDSGIPNFESVWIGSPNLGIFESYLRATLISVPGVIDVTELSLSRQQNTLQYTATIKTSYGLVALNG